MVEPLKNIIIDIISKAPEPVTFDYILSRVRDRLNYVSVREVREELSKLVKEGVIVKEPIPIKSKMGFRISKPLGQPRMKP